MRYLTISSILLFLVACNNQPNNNYLNLDQNINYVGINQCAACHIDQYESFLRTGMGKSFRPALQQYSSSIFNAELYDSNLHFHYYPYWFQDSLFIDEYSLEGNDTTHYMTHKIDYIIGSGHHTNSHLIETNGYLYQAPLTYYTQDSILDFPPGFENNKNSRFSRKMGLECVACHNAYPDFVLGSENKYQHIPNGIDCERCHGPGELHVNNIAQGILVDTSSFIDYNIINPTDLSSELQNDICARCHLQGNAVLQHEKSFFDFKPGMFLKDVMDVYLPRYEGVDNEFIMASHLDRMKMSSCYINSEEKMTCISCHNPHTSVKEMSVDFFNNKCLHCHSEQICSEDQGHIQKANNDCVSCHMPSSKTTDVPHVTITDHNIGVHRAIEQTSDSQKDAVFLGLQCVNNPDPSSKSIAQAYLQQYERFEARHYYLDSALKYMEFIDLSDNQGIYINVYYYFLKQDYNHIIQEVNSLGVQDLLQNKLINRDYNNKDAWTCYRIGEAFMKNANLQLATSFYQQAVKLAPYNLEFRNKYAVALFDQDKVQFAIDEFVFILNEDPNFISAYANLGYIYFFLGQKEEALQYYNYALKLHPYHETTLINKAEFLLFDNNKKDAFICLEKVLEINPDNEKAKILLKRINEI